MTSRGLVSTDTKGGVYGSVHIFLPLCRLEPLPLLWTRPTLPSSSGSSGSYSYSLSTPMGPDSRRCHSRRVYPGPRGTSPGARRARRVTPLRFPDRPHHPCVSALSGSGWRAASFVTCRHYCFGTRLNFCRFSRTFSCLAARQYRSCRL